MVFFESIDTFFVDHRPDFMLVGHLDGKRERFGTNQEGAMWVFDVLDGLEDEDEIGPLTTTPVPTQVIDGRINTRIYTGGSREVKRWLNYQVSHRLTVNQNVDITPVMEDPDITGEIKNFVGTASDDPMNRGRVGRRGRGIQLQWQSNAGRPTLRNTQVQGTVSDRAIQQFK